MPSAAEDIAEMIFAVWGRTSGWDEFLRAMAGYSWLGYSVEQLRVFWHLCERLAPEKP